MLLGAGSGIAMVVVVVWWCFAAIALLLQRMGNQQSLIGFMTTYYLFICFVDWWKRTS